MSHYCGLDYVALGGATQDSSIYISRPGPGQCEPGPGPGLFIYFAAAGIRLAPEPPRPIQLR